PPPDARLQGHHFVRSRAFSRGVAASGTRCGEALNGTRCDRSRRMICLGEPAPFLKSAPRPTAVTIGSPLSPVHYPKGMKNEKSAWPNRRRIRGISCMAQSRTGSGRGRGGSQSRRHVDRSSQGLASEGDRQRHAHHSRDREGGALFKAENAWETPGTVGKVGS